MKKLVVIDEKVKFIKQVRVHPRDRFWRETEREVDFTVDSIKQVPVHPRDRLKRADKKLRHPNNRMKNKVGQLSRDKVSKLMRGELDFNFKKILNKTLIFDTTKITEEIIVDKITEALNDEANDKFYIEYPFGSNYFNLKWEDGR